MIEDTHQGIYTGTTLDRTLTLGQETGRGIEGGYRRLTYGAGEPYLTRRELLTHAPNHARRVTLFYRAVATDFHIVDTASPGRFEFAQRFFGSKGLDLLLPAYRPQDCLQRAALDAAIRTLNGLALSSVSGARLEGLVCLGDLADNAQCNELSQVLNVLTGGAIEPWSPGVGLEGPGADSWDDPYYWRPSAFEDDYKRLFGFPAFPEVLEALAGPFVAAGCRLPWLSCYGNHDALVLGGAISNPAYQRLAIGSDKARLLSRALDVFRHLDLFIPYPELFLTGPPGSVAANPERHTVRREDFVRAHLEAGGKPEGHGFSSANVGGSSAYYVDDGNPAVRLVVLDTVNLSGYYQGSIGQQQFDWLRERLIEVHSRYWSDEGTAMLTTNRDRLVVLCSHHGRDTLINDLSDAAQDPDLPRMLGPQVEALLHRFPNVILWINGHTHRNAVRPRVDPNGNSAGYWEVTTSSLIDWPIQTRLIEIIANGNDSLSIYSTMVDHAGRPNPREEDEPWRLASIHRELAANDPHAGVRAGKQGTPSDRNVELLVPAPFAGR